MKTSLSHPLQIATVAAGPDFGRIGITFCPGKYDHYAMTGCWERDLALDLNTVRDWGAAAVVTLLEPKEITLLRVERSAKKCFAAACFGFISRLPTYRRQVRCLSRNGSRLAQN